MGYLKLVLGILATLVLIIGFQNCGQIQPLDHQSLSGSTSLNDRLDLFFEEFINNNANKVSSNAHHAESCEYWLNRNGVLPVTQTETDTMVLLGGCAYSYSGSSSAGQCIVAAAVGSPGQFTPTNNCQDQSGATVTTLYGSDLHTVKLEVLNGNNQPQLNNIFTVNDTLIRRWYGLGPNAMTCNGNLANPSACIDSSHFKKFSEMDSWVYSEIKGIPVWTRVDKISENPNLSAGGYFIQHAIDASVANGKTLKTIDQLFSIAVF